ncbi:hypothetical protein [Fulvivirga sediminis]|uniref:Uncharacterized protein n=1 Tax=Fulvivirga sediminis TaxID=2803949 RepID=A0A937F8A9_9BACT|nr:hypothetical protein [Fulvivirga sediminis]MBL3658307.1 hypothetical protein [Fulvivirga sediminis]
MMKRFFMLFTLAILVWGCNDDEDYDVVLNSSGNLLVKLVDGEGAPVADGQLMLHLPASTESLLEVLEPDEAGNVDLGTLRSGEYLIDWYVNHNGLLYTPGTYLGVQVLAGEAVEKQINIESDIHLGTLEITIINADTDELVNGAQLLIVQNAFGFDSDMPFEDIMDRGMQYTTDGEGHVSLKLPTAKSFYIYYLDGESNNYLGRQNVSPGDVREVEYEITVN